MGDPPSSLGGFHANLQDSGPISSHSSGPSGGEGLSTTFEIFIYQKQLIPKNTFNLRSTESEPKSFSILIEYVPVSPRSHFG